METSEKQHVVKAAKVPSEDRIVMLSDGIFAIATTLLVLDIKVPDNLLHQVDFNEALMGGFLSKTIMYAVTFLVICGYWISHRQIMNTINHIDRRFIWLNFLFLAFIAFFPATSSLVGAYGRFSSAVIIYTLVLAGCGFSALFLWLYATGKHRLVDTNLDQRAINFRTTMLLIAPVIFLASLVLLFFARIAPNDIFFTWFLIVVIDLIVRRIYRNTLAKENVANTLHYDY